jgi:tRNA(fMet)-specific endonuclease VapC
MSLYILDTDTLSLYQRGLPGLVARVDAQDPGELAITVITVEEEITGWYTLLRQVRSPDEIVRAYERLGQAIPLLARWQILPMSLPALMR